MEWEKNTQRKKGTLSPSSDDLCLDQNRDEEWRGSFFISLAFYVKICLLYIGQYLYMLLTNHTLSLCVKKENQATMPSIDQNKHHTGYNL